MGYKVAFDHDWTLNLPEKRLSINTILNKGGEAGKRYMEQLREVPGVFDEYGVAVFTLDERAQAVEAARDEIGVMLQKVRMDEDLQEEIEAKYQANQKTGDEGLMSVTRRDLEQRMINDRVNKILAWNLVEVYAERFKDSEPKLYTSLKWFGNQMRSDLGADWKAWERGEE